MVPAGYVPQARSTWGQTQAPQQSNMNPLLAINNAKKDGTYVRPQSTGPTAEQRARFGPANYGMTGAGPKFGARTPQTGMGAYPGLQQAINGGALSGGGIGGAGGGAGQSFNPQSAMNASTGINPQTPYTQQQIGQAEDNLRNSTLSVPQLPGSNYGANGALQQLLGDATAGLGGMAATQFAPDASAAAAQYGLGGQMAQADALQGWQQLNANQMTRDMNFNRQKQNSLLNFIGGQMNSPEFSF